MSASAYIHDQRPVRIYWEVTRACDLACRHCRAEAVSCPDPDELTRREAFHLLARLAEFHEPLPHLVLTGGDPLKRADLFDLIAEARRLGFAVSVAPSATPLLTSDAIRRLRTAGVDAISLSLDAATADRHDGIRGVSGTFVRTMAAARAAVDAGLPFQVNTLVCGETVDDLPAVYEHVKAMGAARWSLFFLVTVGRGRVLQPLNPERAEQVLIWAATLARGAAAGGLIVTTTEAPQIRRIAMQQMAAHRPAAGQRPPADKPHAARPAHAAAAGIRDGNGILFVSHTGEICPSGFLEHAGGNVRATDVVEVYRQSPLFTSLRTPDAFTGRCGDCEYRFACGGSRARAWAATGNVLAEDPLCTYVPVKRLAAAG
jgi:radical SAM protein